MNSISSIDYRERFESKVAFAGPDECWLWTAAISKAGYGVFGIGQKVYYSHRIAFALANEGVIPEGCVIDHKCHETSCVNPCHLQAVTQKQNMENRRGAQRNNLLGIRGVSFDPKRGQYTGQVHTKEVNRSTRYFDTAEEAELAVVAIRLELMSNNLADR